MTDVFFLEIGVPPFPKFKYLRVSSHMYYKLLFKNLPLVLSWVSSSMVFFFNSTFGEKWVSAKTFLFIDRSYHFLAAVEELLQLISQVKQWSLTRLSSFKKLNACLLWINTLVLALHNIKSFHNNSKFSTSQMTD